MPSWRRKEGKNPPGAQPHFPAVERFVWTKKKKKSRPAVVFSIGKSTDKEEKKPVQPFLFSSDA